MSGGATHGPTRSTFSVGRSDAARRRRGRVGEGGDEEVDEDEDELNRRATVLVRAAFGRIAAREEEAAEESMVMRFLLVYVAPRLVIMIDRCRARRCARRLLTWAHCYAFRLKPEESTERLCTVGKLLNPSPGILNQTNRTRTMFERTLSPPLRSQAHPSPISCLAVRTDTLSGSTSTGALPSPSLLSLDALELPLALQKSSLPHACSVTAYRDRGREEAEAYWRRARAEETGCHQGALASPYLPSRIGPRSPKPPGQAQCRGARDAGGHS